jgi:glycosyltransferase involved in cell wall biosynthesis
MLSFVVPAHNEEELLPGTLASIHEAAAGHVYEIVVVDDASEDRTLEVARAGGARVVEVQHRHIAATRNAGAATARGERLFFIDADTRINAAYLQQALELLDAGAAGGGARFRFDGTLPLYARLLTPLFDAIIVVMQLTGGCCLFCRRDLFLELGGFNLELYAGEELDLAHRLKRRGRFRIVRARVLTSGRKLRSYSPWELLRVLWGLAKKGPRALKDREGLELWYHRRKA